MLSLTECEISAALADSLSAESILERIHYYRCHNQTELLAVVRILPDLLQSNKRIKLVVIDSIAFHFRADVLDIAGRNRTLSSMASTLNNLAFEHKLSVVVTNHVTTKIVKSVSMDSMSRGGGHFGVLSC
jgi:RAD51-like protein 2